MENTNEIFIVLLPTFECNMRCSYCFEAHPTGRWDIQTTRYILDNIFKFLRNKSLKHCRLHWQGGEPLLLGENYWRKALSMARSFADQQDVHLNQSMQTNLTLYQTSFKPIVQEFFEGVLGTSFDPANMRRFRSGEPDVFLRQWRHAYDTALEDGLEVGVLSMINQKALEMDAREYLSELRNDYGIKKLRFTLPFRTPGENGAGFWLDAHETGLFLSETYRIWYSSGCDDWIEIRPFRHFTERLLGYPVETSGLCVFANNCADIALAVLPNGDVTLCDSFSNPEAGMIYGNIFLESMDIIYNGLPRAMVRQRVAGLVDSECAQCRYMGVCFGGCLVRSRPNFENSKERFHYCETHKLLFHTIEHTVMQAE